MTERPKCDGFPCLDDAHVRIVVRIRSEDSETQAALSCWECACNEEDAGALVSAVRLT